ncbi:EAL domain-containing protein [Aquincola sp. S2]|uniref:EAL domain-containing protein n=1 Tax=Pseudaquabacterium terrae TaxID=2732868 RepID=A0ABX2EEA9_9BURK|nr:GGDEF domain-containing phosphodiesterase [Aquabacterium terrae]NRF66955.1 EAL domain-containing protein [Aquabacterium terrae]
MTGTVAGSDSALFASEQHYRLLFEANPLPMWVYDLLTLRFLDVNDVACRKYGYTREEFLALTIRDIRPAEDVHAVEESVRTMPPLALNAGVWRHRLKDGTLIDVEITSHELLHHGRPARFVCPLDVTQRLRAERALIEREAALHRAQLLARLGHVITRPDGSFESWSESLPELIGIQPHEVPASAREWLVQLVHADDRAAFRAKSIEAAVTGSRVDIEYRLSHGDGTTRHMRQVIEPLPGSGGRWFSTLQDVTEHRRVEDKVRRLIRVHAVLSGINTLIVRVRDRDELFHEACRIAVEEGAFKLAWIAVLDAATQQGQVVARCGGVEGPATLNGFSTREGTPQSEQPASRAVRSKAPVIVNDLHTEPMLAPLRDDVAAANYRALACFPLLVAERAVGVLTLLADEPDVFDADEVKLLEELAGDISFALDHLAKAEKIDYLAYYDALTGLANNTLLRERLGQTLAAAHAEQQRLALTLIDIERFKRINDTLGWHAGDALLRQIGARLVEVAGDEKQLARVGPDQFAIVIPGVRAETDLVRHFANDYQRCFGRPFEVEGRELRVAVKAGIALYPTDGSDVETLYRNAEAAVKKAKAGNERLVFYDQHMTESVAEALALENKLRRALERDEFVLHYQPKVNIATRRIVALEALIRWNSPGEGLVPPMKFIPLMEETGLILEVGAWALRQAALDHQRWVQRGGTAPRLAVNVSAVQLRKPDFVATVQAALACGAEPHGIDIEITESLIMEDIEATIGKLHALRARGVELAIDDFGTGYSSLAYLARLPAQILKIDRAFVKTMLDEPNSLLLVSTMVSLAHSLRMTVVAEGVETEAQASQLLQLGCDQMQGYLVSRPLPFDEVTALFGR